MRKTTILVWILAISLIGGFVSADNWITYNPDANVQWVLNEWYPTEQDFVAWTITITDWTKAITILDRNLWATMTWGWTGVDVWSYGFYYQWWNNYGFPSDTSATISLSSTKVDASDYWPDNPYSSDTFVKRPPNYNNRTSDWSSVRNDNLRWWTWDDDTNWWGLISDNPITGRQWPCPEWYHVPSVWEIDELVVMWYNQKYNDDLPQWSLIDSDTLQGDDINVALDFSKDILMPFASIYWWDEWEIEPYYYNIAGQFWSSTPYSRMWFTLSLTLRNGKSGLIKNAAYFADDNYRSTAMSVRCFKDENETTSKTLTLNIMSGENIISTWINFSDETPTSGQVLDAINWLSTEVELATGYHFQWYTDDAWVETAFDLDSAIASWTITSSLALTWKVEPNKYTISFLDEEGVEIMSGEFTYDQETTLPANIITKQWYTFKWWKDEQWNIYTDWATIKNLTTENGITLKFTPIREKNPQHSVGGGWWSHGSSTVKPDPEIQEDAQNSWNETWHGSAELENWYTKEMNDAYKFAYKNWITTMDSIEKADMFWWLTRIAMAKMLAYYAINVLWMKPDETRINEFNDVSDTLSSQYDNWVKLAYQLWIMWINMPNNKFRPFDLVTRAEFGTALSRMLYKLADGDRIYYSTHLKKLKEEKIITNNDPYMKELRWYVMIMLMRSAMTGYEFDDFLEWELYNEELHQAPQQEVESYFTEAYKMWKIYYKIGDLQRLLGYLWFYNWDINNTYDKNTVNAVYDFQIAMWILDSDDTKNPARWYLWPETRDLLNQKWAEFK